MMPGTWATLFKKTAEQPGTLLFADTAGKLDELAHGDSEGSLELARVLHVA